MSRPTNERQAPPRDILDESRNAPEGDAFELICMADVDPVAVRWLWAGRFPVGMISMIAGDPGLGKSTVALDIAATVTRGRPWPDAPGDFSEPGSVILLSAEDGLNNTVRPRLDAAEADVSRVHVLNGVRQPNGALAPFNLKDDLLRLEEVIRRVEDVRLVIIDPISAYLSDTDDHKNGAVRGLLAPLAEMADRLGFAVILVSHLNKNIGGKSAYRVTGSLAFVAAPRTAWLIQQDPDRPERRLMLPIKNNLADTPGLAFSIVDRSIRWESDPVMMTANQALANEGRPQAKRKSQVDRASDFLHEVLADGRLPSTEVIARGADAGFSERTLRRAKEQANVHAGRSGFGPGGHSYWESKPSMRERTPRILDNYGEYESDGPDERRADDAA
jgi:putative DNA primase/helicase